MKLTAIRYQHIRDWMFYLTDIKNLNPATVNRILATMKVMSKEAVRQGYMQVNPTQDIGVFKEEPKAKSIPTMDEVQKLFDTSTIKDIWNNDFKQYAINLVAASTGMRQGEILGLQRQYVHDGHLEVKYAWSTVGGLKDCKNHEARMVPIPLKTQNAIRELIENNEFCEDETLVFPGRNKNVPDDSSTILGALYRALERIGISGSERERRNITFHSWRHFFNTMSRKNSVPDVLTRRVLGHKTAIMTETYTQLQLRDLGEIQKLQEKIFALS